MTQFFFYLPILLNFASISNKYTTMKKILLSIATLCCIGFTSQAQTNHVKPFDYLDLGVTMGTTGVGLELATHVHDMVRVRAGFSFVPNFDAKMNFGIEGRRQDIDENGNTIWVPTKFDSMADKFQDFTGLEINDNIDMIGTPNFYNGNLLVDFYPIKNIPFHVTAGFYYGSSKVASAINSMEDMASLLGVTMYNNFYDKIANGDPIYGEDVYLTPDMEQKFLEKGRLGIHVGDKVGTDGKEPYMMTPDENSNVTADIIVNSFKPYLGVGYGGRISKRNDNIRIAVDAGVMFWGGTPKVVTHDGTDLAKDVENIGGKVGDYVNFAKSLKVYPVVNLKISFRLF